MNILDVKGTMIDVTVNDDRYLAHKERAEYFFYINGVQIYRCRSSKEIRKILLEYVRKNTDMNEIDYFTLKSIVM